MHLPTPETWETQVSIHGNTTATWQSLLEHRKLPFMAMLRNLRNLILAKMAPRYHNMVVGKLSDDGAVVSMSFAWLYPGVYFQR